MTDETFWEKNGVIITAISGMIFIGVFTLSLPWLVPK